MTCLNHSIVLGRIFCWTFIERCFLYVFFSKFKIPFNKFDKTNPNYSKWYSVTNSWNRVTQKHFWNLMAVFLPNLNAKKTHTSPKNCLDASKSFKWCTKQNLQIYWIQINSKTVCELKPWAAPNKSFLSKFFYGTPCSLLKSVWEQCN